MSASVRCQACADVASRGRPGYAIAFTYSWKLTLVISASVPLIALAALMQGRVMFGLNAQARTSGPRSRPARLPCAWLAIYATHLAVPAQARLFCARRRTVHAVRARPPLLACAPLRAASGSTCSHASAGAEQNAAPAAPACCARACVPHERARRARSARQQTWPTRRRPRRSAPSARSPRSAWRRPWRRSSRRSCARPGGSSAAPRSSPGSRSAPAWPCYSWRAPCARARLPPPAPDPVDGLRVYVLHTAAAGSSTV